MLIDSAQARDISIICHLWNYLEPSLKPGEKVGGGWPCLGGFGRWWGSRELSEL